MSDRKPIGDLDMLHWRPTCLIRDSLETTTCFIRDSDWCQIRVHEIIIIRGDLSETHWRPTCLIRDPSETDIFVKCKDSHQTYRSPVRLTGLQWISDNTNLFGNSNIICDTFKLNTIFFIKRINPFNDTRTTL